MIIDVLDLDGVLVDEIAARLDLVAHQSAEQLVGLDRILQLHLQQDAIKAGYFGFFDRFRALPGDYSGATANIANISTTGCTGNGDGNGRIEATGSNTPRS